VSSFLKYDTFGRIKRVEPGGGEAISFVYGGWGKASKSGKQPLEVTQTGDSGWRLNTFYDVLGRQISQTSYSREDGKGVETDQTFNELGRVATVSIPHFEGTTTLKINRLFFDGVGRPTRIEAASGAISACTYAGLQTECYDRDPADPTAIKTTETMNLGGQVVSSVEHARANGPVPARDLILSYRYGPFGVSQSVGTKFNGLGGYLVESGYDRLGRIISSTDPTRGQREVRYDGFGQLISETVNSITVVSRQFQYDPLSRLTNITTSDGSTTLAWDSAPHGVGQLSSVTSPKALLPASLMTMRAGR
jgi:YD repeat-containing protein